MNLGLDLLSILTFSNYNICEDIITNLSGINIQKFRDGLKYQAALLSAYAHCEDKNLYTRLVNVEYCLKLDYMYSEYTQTKHIPEEDEYSDYIINLVVPEQYKSSCNINRSLFNPPNFGRLCVGNIDVLPGVDKEFTDAFLLFKEYNYDLVMPISDIKTFGYNAKGEFGMYTNVPVNTLSPESVKVFKAIINIVRKTELGLDVYIIDDYLNMIINKSQPTDNYRIFGVEYSTLVNKEGNSLKNTYNNMYTKLVTDGSGSAINKYSLEKQYLNLKIQCDSIIKNNDKDYNSSTVKLPVNEYASTLDKFESIITTFSEKEKDLYQISNIMNILHDETHPMHKRYHNIIENVIGRMAQSDILDKLSNNTKSSIRTIVKIALVLAQITPESYNNIYYSTGINFEASNVEDSIDGFNTELMRNLNRDLKKLNIVGFNILPFEMMLTIVKDISIITEDLSGSTQNPSTELVKMTKRLNRAGYSYYSRMKEVV